MSEPNSPQMIATHFGLLIEEMYKRLEERGFDAKKQDLVWEITLSSSGTSDAEAGRYKQSERGQLNTYEDRFTVYEPVKVTFIYGEIEDRKFCPQPDRAPIEIVITKPITILEVMKEAGIELPEDEVLRWNEYAGTRIKTDLIPVHYEHDLEFTVSKEPERD